MADPDPPQIPDHPGSRATRQLGSETFASMPMALAALERLGPQYVLALRLGTLALIQAAVRELAQPSASRADVDDLQKLVTSLSQMPFDR